MTNKEILQADFLDILFEHRNKAYGAYALRKSYNHRLQWALAISLSLILFLLVANFSQNNNSGRPPDNQPGLKLSIVEFAGNKPKKIDPPKPKIKSQLAQVAYTSRVKFVNDKEKTQMPDKTEIDKSLISGKTIEGIKSSGMVGEGNNEPGNGNVSAQSNTKEEGASHFTQADAEFPGGKDAFAKFLTKYLITPGDLEPGEKKTVLVRFMVDVDGNISKTQILQSDGELYSKEVLRVLSKMPKWIPARQNGINVTVWFTQPVTFIGAE